MLCKRSLQGQTLKNKSQTHQFEGMTLKNKGKDFVFQNVSSLMLETAPTGRSRKASKQLDVSFQLD